MNDALAARGKRTPPWRGRMRVTNARSRFIAVRCTPQEHAAIQEAAAKSGLSVGALLRALALGDAGPRAVRRPPIERRELARLLGWLGKLGSNVNQIAKAIHTSRNLPSWSELAAIREDVMQMRAALLKALGRGD
jgi:hypothetical protein